MLVEERSQEGAGGCRAEGQVRVLVEECSQEGAGTDLRT